jgi:ABC-type Fe3+/spermidine/putrescine transport system ATPase subunit
MLRVLGRLPREGRCDRLGRQASEKPQGRKPRARFARRRPRLLLLDEPLSNLDAKLREQMRFELQELISRTGVTTLYVTHDQSEALAMSDTVAVMSAGRIVQSGAPRNVYGRPDNRMVANFLGNANILRGKVVDVRDELATVALDGGADTIDVPSRASLSPGAPVDVIFRPEDVTTCLDPADGAIECTVERVVFQGGMSECQLRFGAALLRTVVHPALGARPGDRAWISIQADRCILFAAN